MAGSSYGTLFTITTWGESHGEAIGVTIDGCPAGLSLDVSDIQTQLDYRKPGQSKFTTQRKEGDQVEILSGTFEGKTTGTPISLIVRNTNQKSRDYGNISKVYRPGHADYTFEEKYGIRDYRGGGRSSGRETIGRVAAGAIALKLLNELGITVQAYTKSIGPVSIPESEYNFKEIHNNTLYMPNSSYAEEAAKYLSTCMQNQDSAGGTIECLVHNMPVGVGQTVFEKLDANLAKGLMSIGAVKGVEIGDGFEVATSNGSSNNDSYYIGEGAIKKSTNHSGGTLGGMSDGSTIITRVAIKPTPSISSLQHAVTSNKEELDINIHGRHDPIIVPRAVVVVKSMVALTIIDGVLINMTSRLDKIKNFYE
ncbi:MAG: chorismate synthase [Eubacteriales bacterium]